VRKEVCRSIVKRPFCIHPAMQVFADMRPSLVLVVRSRREPATLAHFCSGRIVSSDLASTGHVRGCAIDCD